MKAIYVIIVNAMTEAGNIGIVMKHEYQLPRLDAYCSKILQNLTKCTKNKKSVESVDNIVFNLSTPKIKKKVEKGDD